MLASPDYAAIKEDYDRISRTHFERDNFHPEGMSFAGSDALFPPAAIAGAMARDYDEQCRTLCYGSAPPWNEVQAALIALRPLLQRGPPTIVMRAPISRPSGYPKRSERNSLIANLTPGLTCSHCGWRKRLPDRCFARRIRP